MTSVYASALSVLITSTFINPSIPCIASSCIVAFCDIRGISVEKVSVKERFIHASLLYGSSITLTSRNLYRVSNSHPCCSLFANKDSFRRYLNL